MNFFDEQLERVLANVSGDTFPWPFNYSSAAAEASRVVKSDEGYLFGFTVSNANAAARFIQLFDATTVPTDSAVPVLSVQIAATNHVGVAWIPPRYFATGIVIVASTTQNTKTLAGSDHLFDVQYV